MPATPKPGMTKISTASSPTPSTTISTSYHWA